MNTILTLGMPGAGEMMVIAVFIIIFFGAKKIPEIAKSLGQGIREFKNAAKEITKEIEDGNHGSDRKIK